MAPALSDAQGESAAVGAVHVFRDLSQPSLNGQVTEDGADFVRVQIEVPRNLLERRAARARKDDVNDAGADEDVQAGGVVGRERLLDDLFVRNLKEILELTLRSKSASRHGHYVRAPYNAS